MTTQVISTEDCSKHRELIRQWITPAMMHSAGESTIDDILDKLEKGSAHCWMFNNSQGQPIMVGVTELIQMGRKKVCHIITTTGDWKAAHETHNIIEDYAKAVGCDSVMVWGRPGWARELTKFEFDSGRKYQQSYVVLEMKLGDNNENN